MRRSRFSVSIRLAPVIAALFAVGAGGCGDTQYSWAFAQNMDNSFHPNEFCRESLAQTIYAPQTREQIEATDVPNVFVFRGQIETYRIYGFRSQAECETALTNIKARQ